MKRIIHLGGLLVVAGVCAHSARADGLSGLYFGGSFGRAENTYDTGFIDGLYEQSAAAAGDKLKFDATSVHRWDHAWWANAGYMAWSYVGFDASFLNVGELTHQASGAVKASTGNLPFTDMATLSSHGPALCVLFRLPLTEALALDMRLGDYYAKTALTAGTTYRSKYVQQTETHTGSSLLATVGAAYTFAWHWSVRVDYLRINDAGNSDNVGKYSVNMASVGASFIF
jgi:OmpA-like transmembrane domain